MGMDELAGKVLIARRPTQLGWETVPNLGGDLVVFVQDCEDAVEVGNQQFIPATVEVAGLTHTVGDKPNVLAVQSEILKSAVAPVRDYE